MKKILLATSIGVAVSCTNAEESQPMSPVEFICDVMLDRPGGSACEFTPGNAASLRVWVGGEAPQARIDEVSVSPAAIRAVDAGHLLTITVPDRAGELLLTRNLGVPEHWRLGFAWRDGPPDENAVGDAYAESRWRDCQVLADDAFAVAVAARRSLGALRIAQTAVHCSTRLGDPAAVGDWYARARRLPSGPDLRGLLRDTLEVHVLLDQGALHSVGGPLARALQRSNRLQTTGIHSDMLSLQSLALAEVGDFDGAVTAARASLDRTAHPYLEACEDADLRINLAWILLLAAGRTGTQRAASVEAEDELLRALGVLEDRESACSPESLQVARLNLVRVSLMRDAPQVAALWLAEVAASGPLGSPAVVGEMQMLAARIALAASDRVAAASALAHAREHPNLPADLHLEITTTAAELAEAQGDLPRARALYQEAHQRTLDRLGDLGHDQSAHRFVFDHLRASQQLARLLYRIGAAADAFRVAREAASSEPRLLAQRVALARRRPASQTERHDYLELRAIHERLLLERWDLAEAHHELLIADARATAALFEPKLMGDGIPVDQRALPFREPVLAELLLLFLPFADDQLLGFASTANGVAVMQIDTAGLPRLDSKLDAGDLAAWSERLLSPFRSAIDSAQRIQILPSFGLQALPFHAFPWRGKPLLAHAAVEYTLDLPPAGMAREDRSGRALVIGDPHGDLDGARREAAFVATELRARGITIEALIGRQADGPSVRSVLPQVDHLHYAGHSESAGPFGWHGFASLGQGTFLSIPDILALDRVPATVSLLSCDSGIISRDPRRQSMALANAFLLAGSQTVLASTHPLSASEAPEIAVALYARNIPAGLDLRSAYRATLLGPLAERLAPITWQSLRIWTP